MEDLAYSAVCRDVVERIGRVDADDEVVVVTDPRKADLARPFAAAARAAGATTSLVVKPRLDAHNAALPDAVAGAIRDADAVFDVNTHTFAHTETRRTAAADGTRFVFVPAVTGDVLAEQLDSDYGALRRVTRAVAAVQTAADGARLTCPNGSDLAVDLAGSTALPITDDLDDEGLVVLPVGKAAITPVEGSAEGRVVVDHWIDDVGVVDEPVTLHVTDGRATEVTGGRAASDLRRLLDAKGPRARNVAEAPSVGTNPDVELVGNHTTDKKKRGTAHVAVGDDVSLGGDVECDVHLDMVVTRPTVTFEGVGGGDGSSVTAVEEGTFREAAVWEAAARLDRAAGAQTGARSPQK